MSNGLQFHISAMPVFVCRICKHMPHTAVQVHADGLKHTILGICICTENASTRGEQASTCTLDLCIHSADCLANALVESECEPESHLKPELPEDTALHFDLLAGSDHPHRHTSSKPRCQCTANSTYFGATAQKCETRMNHCTCGS